MGPGSVAVADVAELTLEVTVPSLLPNGFWHLRGRRRAIDVGLAAFR